jgi:hypothetical protein
MKVSRRGILAGLLAAGAAPAVAVEGSPGPTFIKGMILPRTKVVPELQFCTPSYYGPMVIVEYDIYDGEKFVALNSAAGQRVVEDMR